MSGMGPESSALRIDSNLEKKLEGASHAEILQALHDAALQQGLVQPDPYSGELLATALADAAPKRFARTLVVDGEKHVIEADSPEALNDAEIEFHRELQRSAQQQEQSRDAQGRFTSEPQRGGQSNEAIDTATASAVEAYLASRGISTEALREASDTGYVRNWQSASEQFLARHPDWAGGENKDRLGQMLIELNLEDAPSVDSLERAYVELRRRNAYIEHTPEVQAARAAQEIGNAMNVEEIRELGRRSIGMPASSGVFGGR